MEIKYLLKNSILLASLVLGAGCAHERGLITDTGFKRTPTPLASPTNIKGNEPRKATQKDHPYNLERVVINGYDLYVKPNTHAAPEETGFFFIKFNDHRKVLDNSNKLIDIVSDTIYIPTLFKDKDGMLETITYKIDGIYGKKAKITKYNVERIETGIIKETEQDTRYNIGTMLVAGKEWHVPRVEEQKMRETNALPFYMMNSPTSEKEITKDGQITIINKNGFYRPMAVSRADYKKRTEAPTAPPNSPGQAGATGP